MSFVFYFTEVVSYLSDSLQNAKTTWTVV